MNGINKTVTVAVKDGQNPVEGIIEAILLDPNRKQIILDTGDPRKIIEKIKRQIAVQKIGSSPAGSFIYRCNVFKFRTCFQCVVGSRFGEDMSYNPF